MGEKCSDKFRLRIRLPRNSRDLLHAANLRRGTDGFTSPPKEGVLRIFLPLNIRRIRPGLNPRTWVPKASTLPLDHRSRCNLQYTSMNARLSWQPCCQYLAVACFRGSTVTTLADRQREILISGVQVGWRVGCGVGWEVRRIGVLKVIPLFIFTVKLYLHLLCLTLRLLMSYIYGAPILDVSRSHTTTQHSR